MRTASRRPIATSLLLVGAMTLFAGCGDEGAHLPAGMTGSSAAYSAGGGAEGVDAFLGGDPGPQTAGVTSQIDDPVLAGYDGIDEVGELGTDDVYGRAISDWNETEGALNGLDSDINLDDDGFLPAGYGGYGGGYGYDDGLGFNSGYGYGNGLMTAAMSGVGYGDAGLMDAGFVDPGFEDPGFVDPGFEDPGFVDPGFVDPGFDAGIDPGFADPGFDAAVADPGFVDAGFDPGVADVGFDPGFVDAGVADVGIVDAGIEGMVF